MLHFIHSNKMEILSTRLIELLASFQKQDGGQDNPIAAAKGLLTPSTVLVQSPGMAQWLKLAIAANTGLMANVEFPLPSTYIWSLYQRHFDDLPDTSAFTKDNLAWKVLALLPEVLGESEFVALRNYLDGSDTGLKYYQLAVKIADVYDQYLMYRPDWILAWEKGSDDVQGADVTLQPWQPILWRKIVSYSQSIGESVYHRANMHRELLSRIDAGYSVSEPLFIFGMSTIPTPQLEVFAALAEKRPVFLFWLNPSEHFWADIVDARQLANRQLSLILEPSEVKASALALSDVGHPLLASWGKVGRDFLSQLLDLPIEQEDLFSAPLTSSLLSHIQYDIFCLNDIQDGTREQATISLADKSVQVTVAYSALRELEILREHIYHWVQSGVIDSVDEVVVMMPDVASYAPFIDAVFSSSEQIAIPYAISDRNMRQEYHISETFLALLSSHHSRLSFNDVFDIFEVADVANQFGVTPEDLQVIKRWCKSANIRWAMDGKDKARWGVPHTQENTWIFGIRRLLSGFACGTEDVLNDGLVMPVHEVEGRETEALGKFLLFIDALHGVSTVCQQSQMLLQKVQFAEQILNNFFIETDENSKVILAIREALTTLAQHQRQYTEDISQDVFVAALQQQIDSQGVGQRFLTGRVNFTTLMPMRSIPFKVVCLLGMNDTDYPRQVKPVGFDLMQYGKPRRGDRSRRMDDRYLFLEALMSARTLFYISYVGRSQQDNSKQNPSILVSELLDYCDQYYQIESTEGVAEKHRLSEQITTEYPLQPYHPDNFSLQPSYHNFWHRVAVAMTKQYEAAPYWERTSELIIKQIEEFKLTIRDELFDVTQLIRFLGNTCAHHFRHSWNTQFFAPSESAEDNEPLMMNRLTQYWLVGDLLDSANDERVKAAWISRGELPQKSLGEYTFSGASSLASQMCATFHNATGTDIADVVIVSDVIPLGNIEIRCQFRIVRQTTQHILVLHRPGKLRQIDRIHLFVQLCIASLSEKVQVSSGYFLATDKICQLACPDKATATSYLSMLIELFEHGKTHPIPFFPKTAETWRKQADKDKTLATFNGNDFSEGEGQDPHAKRVFPDLSHVFEAFDYIQDRILGPIEKVESDK